MTEMAPTAGTSARPSASKWSGRDRPGGAGATIVDCAPKPLPDCKGEAGRPAGLHCRLGRVSLADAAGCTGRAELLGPGGAARPSARLRLMRRVAGERRARRWSEGWSRRAARGHSRWAAGSAEGSS